MPAAHRSHLEWTPSRLIAWGGEVGPHTADLVRQLLEACVHPEHGYRSSLGLMSLRRVYSGKRLEAACRRALKFGLPTYRSVKSILLKGLDKLDDEQIELSLPTQHAHIRGPGYYASHDNGKEN